MKARGENREKENRRGDAEPWHLCPGDFGIAYRHKVTRGV